MAVFVTVTLVGVLLLVSIVRAARSPCLPGFEPPRLSAGVSQAAGLACGALLVLSAAQPARDRLLLGSRASAFSAPVLRSLMEGQLPPLEDVDLPDDQLEALGDLASGGRPYRAGRVLMVTCPSPVIGRAFEVPVEWSALPAAVRARTVQEVDTLVAVHEYKPWRLVVYDLRRRALVATLPVRMERYPYLTDGGPSVHVSEWLLGLPTPAGVAAVGAEARVPWHLATIPLCLLGLFAILRGASPQPPFHELPIVRARVTLRQTATEFLEELSTLAQQSAGEQARTVYLYGKFDLGIMLVGCLIGAASAAAGGGDPEALGLLALMAAGLLGALLREVYWERRIVREAQEVTERLVRRVSGPGPSRPLRRPAADSAAAPAARPEPTDPGVPAPAGRRIGRRRDSDAG